MSYLDKLFKLASKFEKKISKVADTYEMPKPMHAKTTPMMQSEMHFKEKPKHIITTPLEETELHVQKRPGFEEDSDYEPCRVCGYDHSYDFDFLSPQELKEVEKKHLEEGSISREELDQHREYLDAIKKLKHHSKKY